MFPRRRDDLSFFDFFDYALNLKLENSFRPKLHSIDAEKKQKSKEKRQKLQSC
jgi:hypothetical protein